MACFEKLPTVNFCCCCIGLEPGCFTLGICKFLSSWTVILLAIIRLSNVEKIRDLTFEKDDDYYIYTLTGLIIYELLVFAGSLILMYGSFRKNIRLVYIYLWLEMLLTIFLGIVVTISVVFTILHGPSLLQEGLLLVLVVFSFKVYLFICAVSYYLDLWRQKSRSAFAATFNLATAPTLPIVAQSHLYPHIYYTQPH